MSESVFPLPGLFRFTISLNLLFMMVQTLTWSLTAKQNGSVWFITTTYMNIWRLVENVVGPAFLEMVRGLSLQRSTFSYGSYYAYRWRAWRGEAHYDLYSRKRFWEAIEANCHRFYHSCHAYSSMGQGLLAPREEGAWALAVTGWRDWDSYAAK